MMNRELGWNGRCDRCGIFSYHNRGALVCVHCVKKESKAERVTLATTVTPVATEPRTERPTLDEMRALLPPKKARRKRAR